MAESQAPYGYTPETLVSLQAAISSPRFYPYRNEAAGDDAYAVELYLFNARVAKSLLYPLQMAEVTVRNAVNQVFVRDFGQRWPFTGDFVTEYANHPPMNAINEAVARLGRIGKCNPSTSDVVAALTFDFWSNLFRNEYDRFLWATSRRLQDVFPRLPPSETRPNVQALVRRVNRLRNRIAHHEPIIERKSARRRFRSPDDLPLQDLHADILRLIDYCCETTQVWVKHHSTFGRTMRDKPAKGTRTVGQPISNAASKGFSRHQLHDKLDAALAALATNDGIGLVDLPGQVVPSYAALTSTDVVAWAAASVQGGYVPFEDGTVADALRHAPVRCVVRLPGSATMGEAAALMYAPGVPATKRPWLIVAMDSGQPPEPIGILVRPVVKIS
jgi:hypothetical protein